MARYIVKPPQLNIVQAIDSKPEDYRPPYEGIHFHIVDTVTGKHTGDDFENEADANARAAELNSSNP